MNASELQSLLTRTMTALPKHSEELRTLDAAIGDGDLGITVGSGAKAIVAALQTADPRVDFQAILQLAAKAFSTANPSTFAALVGGGLLAASKTMAGKASLSQMDAAIIGDAVAARIMERGKSKLGDKTILDALIPSLKTLRAQNADACMVLDAMIATAQTKITETAELQSAKGRAAWAQERSIGQADPGATAYLRFLQELRASWEQ